ncbi:hypothetical protein FJY63_01895, partial [Candidatus Sumerlaeota bacterium]|nr:hypothetical protein [Candidatus Sumerlaeota bacterium]
ADTEGEAIALFEHLNCPHCGGSGHIDDTPKSPADTDATLPGNPSLADRARLAAGRCQNARHSAATASERDDALREAAIVLRKLGLPSLPPQTADTDAMRERVRWAYVEMERSAAELEKAARAERSLSEAARGTRKIANVLSDVLAALSPTHTVSDMGVDAPQRGGEALREAEQRVALALFNDARARMNYDPMAWEQMAEVDREESLRDARVAVAALTADKPDTQGLRQIARALRIRMATACDHTRPGKDHVKVRTADWHVLMNIADEARTALNQFNDQRSRASRNGFLIECGAANDLSAPMRAGQEPEESR